MAAPIGFGPPQLAPWVGGIRGFCVGPIGGLWKCTRAGGVTSAPKGDGSPRIWAMRDAYAACDWASLKTRGPMPEFNTNDCGIGGAAFVACNELLTVKSGTYILEGNCWPGPTGAPSNPSLKGLVWTAATCGRVSRSSKSFEAGLACCVVVVGRWAVHGSCCCCCHGSGTGVDMSCC